MPLLAPVTSRLCPEKFHALCFLLDAYAARFNAAAAVCHLTVLLGPDPVPQRCCFGIAIELLKQEGQTLGGFQVLAINLQGALVGVNGWLVLPLLFVEHAALHVVFNLWRFVSRGLLGCRGSRGSPGRFFPLLQRIELL